MRGKTVCLAVLMLCAVVMAPACASTRERDAATFEAYQAIRPVVVQAYAEIDAGTSKVSPDLRAKLEAARPHLAALDALGQAFDPATRRRRRIVIPPAVRDLVFSVAVDFAKNTLAARTGQ